MEKETWKEVWSVDTSLDLLNEIKKMMSDDYDSYTDEVIRIVWHFTNQLIDMSCDSYGLGISKESRDKAYKAGKQLERLIKVDLKWKD